MKPNYTKPALIGGAVMGVLSALPIVQFGNACCCLWVISGGVTAAYLLQQDSQTSITLGDGALAGLLAGLIGAGVHFVISIPIDLLMAPLTRHLVERMLDVGSNFPPELRTALERANRQSAEGGFALMFAFRVLGLMIWLVIMAAFSTLGGIVGAAIFQKKLPPGTIDVPPVPSQ
jgi:hypothetical protein